MTTALVITIGIVLVSLVAILVIRPTDVDVAARGLRVRLRRRAERHDADRDPPR
jgi:hypothetical protein